MIKIINEDFMERVLNVKRGLNFWENCVFNPYRLDNQGKVFQLPIINYKQPLIIDYKDMR